MIILDDKQNEFADFPFSEYVIDQDHPLVKLANAIHWKNLLEELAKFYVSERGRPSIPLRAQTGTFMLKFLKNLPDRDTVHYVCESIPAQYFCGLHPSKVKGYMTPSSGLSDFRKKIGPEGMALIQEALEYASRGRPFRKNDKLIVDTPCVPLDIHYPTDIKLLEKSRRGILKLFKEAKSWGLSFSFRTDSRVARKIFTHFAKLSKPKEETRKKVHRQLFQFVRRNFKQLQDLRTKTTLHLGKKAASSKKVRKFLLSLKTVESRIQIILHQQKLVRKGFLHIPERIVSFHKDHVRPIVRGKFPLPTEFGPKILVAIVNKRLHLVGNFYSNVSDATLVVPALRWFKQKFGCLPKEILGDRGFFSRSRVAWLKKLNILSGLQHRGKNIQQLSSHRRQIKQRLPIEAFISLTKRKFGLNRCRARIFSHESSWINLGITLACVHKKFCLSRSP